MLKLGNYKIKFIHDTQRRTSETRVYNSNGAQIGEGFSKTSKDDSFDRKVGRKTTLQRAISKLDRNERSDIWNDFFKSNIKWK